MKSTDRAVKKAVTRPVVSKISAKPQKTKGKKKVN